MTLEFTGERFMTECQGEMVYEHWHRYLIAREHVKGKRVLDVASGEGYGTHLLSGVAESVVGVDLSADAVAHASKKYTSHNLQYIAASCTQIPQPDHSFDVIVSFETIEHIREQEAFLREINRLLKPDGLFIISSPNRVEYSEKTGYKNEYHVKELDRAELKALLDQYWPEQKWFAQRAAFHSMVWPLDEPVDSARALAIDGLNAYPGELYFVVICGKTGSVASIRGSALTLVTDRDNAVYAEWSRTYKENAQLRERIAAQISAPSSDGAEPWLVRIARKISRVEHA
jgi:SAM-dependent methyltransferase